MFLLSLLQSIHHHSTILVFNPHSSRRITRLLATIRVQYLHRPIGILPSLVLRCVELSPAIGEMDYPVPVGTDALDCSIRKRALLLPIRADQFHCLVRKSDLFRSIRTVLLCLPTIRFTSIRIGYNCAILPAELEHLKFVWVCGVCCLGLSIEVHLHRDVYKVGLKTIQPNYLQQNHLI